jgi:hypothetical protein
MLKQLIQTTLLTLGLIGYASFSTGVAADTLKGQVLGGGQPIVNSTVTLWAASAGSPSQLGQTRTGVDGSFTINSTDTPDKDAILYLIANGGQPKANAQSGDNPAIALMAVIGNKAPATVKINEMTTVASVWTHAQFLDGSAIKVPLSASALPLATCLTSLIFNRAAGEQQFKTRSIAARHQRWLTSPRLLM